MASVNKAIILGNLGAEPELRATQTGQSVCELRVCTNEQWTDKQGAKQERAEWHRIVCWGKTAENAAKYLTKGQMVFIEGKIQTRQWDDKEGNKRYTTEIVADRLQFLGGGAGKGEQGGRGDRDAGGAGRAERKASTPPAGGRDWGAGAEPPASGGGRNWGQPAGDGDASPGAGGAAGAGDDDIPF